MKRVSISFKRIESLMILECLALKNASIYKALNKLETFLSAKGADKEIRINSEMKKVDFTVLLMQIASIEKRVVNGFMRDNLVELGLAEIEIIESGLRLLEERYYILDNKLKRVKNILKNIEDEVVLPVIFDSSALEA